MTPPPLSPPTPPIIPPPDAIGDSQYPLLSLTGEQASSAGLSPNQKEGDIVTLEITCKVMRVGTAVGEGATPDYDLQITQAEVGPDDNENSGIDDDKDNPDNMAQTKFANRVKGPGQLGME